MIFSGASTFTIILCVLASASSIHAAPSPFEYPEVIPGEGLPSLASLGLTSKGLYEDIGVSEKRSLLSRYDRICYDNGCGRVPRGDAQACINYLRNLGTQACTVPGSGQTVTMCRAGQAIIYGYNPTGHSVSSYCSDVALGGQHVIDGCTDGNSLVAGE
ncbi:hypothetical protein M408DRAFT_299648 [Serendipita vermifera MAFF 305830]|uniref:Cyanovirin-N domain-containing protein n=1 Tax=Serendipita vermifera MAFF 305830 TaxID=933852 RepID=A0A0C3AP69_SERVB|nr:hypothetical protein M408DRAFT_299648 [Serendipita vermifera MAFF 305830]